ncbi:MAG TPA: hypothetical protein VIX91_12225 [Candidatus Acidoferrum sp.]
MPANSLGEDETILYERQENLSDYFLCHLWCAMLPEGKTCRKERVIPVTVFAVTAQEIQNADKYEVLAVRAIATASRISLDWKSH